MNRREFLTAATATAALPIIARAQEGAVDVLVYGATPAGIAAAISAARDGRSVLLIEPTHRIGGLVTCGLSHTDFRTFEGITGLFLEFSRRVEKHYRETYGPDSPQAKGNFRGTHAEPKVNLLVFQKMLAEYPKITVQTSRTLREVEVPGTGYNRIMQSATFVDDKGAAYKITASFYIDATYEGDLMAMAGVKHTWGREGRDKTRESLAPEAADKQLQGYNFRLCMTQDPQNRVLPKAPPGYRREDFLELVPLLTGGKLKQVFVSNTGGIFKAQLPPLPNGKHDINDVSHGLVRLSLPGDNAGWPDGDAAERRKIFDEHVRWNVGLLYFLQNDEAVPAKFRDEARLWGLCKDEFVETDHLPPQLYVREARRMIGFFLFSEQCVQNSGWPVPAGALPGTHTGPTHDARAQLWRDAIAMGDYGPNCHGTAHEGSRFGGRHTGEFYKPVPPYQIPAGVIAPMEVRNLLVPVACSATHVGFCALRLEPIWASLGQAAGHMAHQLLIEPAHRGTLHAHLVQQRLHQLGAATIYVSDVLPGHEDFAMVQWWGTAGGLHGLAPATENHGQRGKQITGQYFEAFPNHAAELDRVLDAGTGARWRELAAATLGMKRNEVPAVDGKQTRKQWLKMLRR